MNSQELIDDYLSRQPKGKYADLCKVRNFAKLVGIARAIRPANRQRKLEDILEYLSNAAPLTKVFKELVKEHPALKKGKWYWVSRLWAALKHRDSKPETRAKLYQLMVGSKKSD